MNWTELLELNWSEKSTQLHDMFVGHDYTEYLFIYL